MLGDSDKPAGKIPSEMQKRCTGEKMLLIITHKNGLLIGWCRAGRHRRAAVESQSHWGKEGCPHGFLSSAPGTPVPGILSSSGNTAASP